jgi:hypothetical protein
MIVWNMIVWKSGMAFALFLLSIDSIGHLTLFRVSGILDLAQAESLS